MPDGDWYLDIDYLDTVASVFTSTARLAMLAPITASAATARMSAAMLKAGDNIDPRRLCIRALPPARTGRTKQPFYIPYSTGNSPIPDGNMLRKPQCHFGWDWNIAIAPLGLYGTIALRKLEIARIEHVPTRQSAQCRRFRGSAGQCHAACQHRPVSCRCIFRSTASACASTLASVPAKQS